MVDGVFATKSPAFWRIFQTVAMGYTPILQWAVMLDLDGVVVTMGAWGRLVPCKSVRGWGGKGRPKGLTRKR